MVSGPAPREAFRGRAPSNDCLCPPNENCAPPSEDCAPKKLTGSGLLECKSRPETPKLVFTARIFVIFVDSHRISYNFWDEDLFFWSSLKNLWKIARVLRRQPEFVEIFELKTFFWGGFTLFVWSALEWISRAPKNLFLPPPPPQSRYPGATGGGAFAVLNN